LQLTLRRLLTALAVFAVGLAGARSPNTLVLFLSVETLIGGVPLILAWRFLPASDRLLALCVWGPITSIVSMLITVVIYAAMHSDAWASRLASTDL
jgi:hypothetical protein